MSEKHNKAEEKQKDVSKEIEQPEVKASEKRVINEEDIIEAIRKKQEAKLRKEKEEEELEEDEMPEGFNGLEGLDFNMIKEQAEQAAKAINEKISKAEEQAIEYKAAAQRIQAEFDNYRKRNAYAVSEAMEDGQIDIIKSFLPIIDNFERALACLKDNVDRSNYEGIEMIYKQCIAVLESNKIEEIDALGQQFDPALHNAVMQTPISKGQKEDEIIAVFQKGYKKGDKIIRHSMVNVAK